MEKFKIKLALLAQLDQAQRSVIVKVFELLESGNNVKKIDVRAMVDFTRLSNSEVCNISKLTRKQIAEISGKDPTIKNSDGSYSLINLIQYLRGKGSVEQGDGSIESKRRVETAILEKKLADLEENSVLRSFMDEQFGERLEHLLICLTNEPRMNAWMYENKSTDEIRELLKAFIRRAMMEYKGSFEVATPETENTTKGA